MIRPELLNILSCPETHQRLNEATAQLVEKFNARIAAGELRNRKGEIVAKMTSALIRSDGKAAYPVYGKLPILLIDESFAV